MEKTTLSQKVDVDLAEKFKELQVAAGGTGQDFIEILLAAYTQAQVDTDTSSPIYKEQVKVRQSLAQVERVVCAFLELASADKVGIQEKARIAVEEARKKVSLLDEMVDMGSNTIAELEKERDELHERVNALVGAAESLDTLKSVWVEKETSWKEKESTLNNRIAELDVEAKQARKLSETVVGLEKEIVQKSSALALADQQAKHDQGSIKDLKKLVEKVQGQETGLRTKLSTAQQALNTEKLDCSSRLNQTEKEYSSRINEIEKAAAEGKGRLVGELSSLKEQFSKAQEKIVALESGFKMGTDKSKDVKDQNLSLPGFD